LRGIDTPIYIRLFIDQKQNDDNKLLKRLA